MSAPESLRAVRTAPCLAGRRVRWIDGQAFVAALLALVAALPAGSHALTGSAVWGWGLACAALAGSVVVLLRTQHRAQLCNESGITLLRGGKPVEAARTFAGAFDAPMFRGATAAVLGNISTATLRAGDAESAVHFARVALHVYGPERDFGAAWHRTTLATALLAAGRLDEAEETLGAIDPSVRGTSRAAMLRARAVLLCRRGRTEEARALLDRDRVFLWRASAGVELALLEALDGHTRGAHGSAFRSAAPVTESDALGYGPQARAYVERLLPEAHGTGA